MDESALTPDGAPAAFFPRFQMADADPTPVATIHRLVSRARRILPHVLPGNC